MIFKHRVVTSLCSILALGCFSSHAQEKVIDVQKNVVNVKDKGSKVNSTVKLGPKKNLTLKGNGQIVTDSRELQPCYSIDITGAYDVELQSSSANKTEISLSADANLLDNIKTMVENDQLHIYTEKPFTSANRIAVVVKMPKLRGIYCNGASSVKALTVHADILTIQIAGATTMKLAGQALLLRAGMEGAGELNALKLSVEKVDMTLSGAAKAKVWVMDRLTVKASGASEVYYFGRPARIVQNLSGAAELKQLKAGEE